MATREWKKRKACRHPLEWENWIDYEGEPAQVQGSFTESQRPCQENVHKTLSTQMSWEVLRQKLRLNRRAETLPRHALIRDRLSRWKEYEQEERATGPFCPMRFVFERMTLHAVLHYLSHNSACFPGVLLRPRTLGNLLPPTLIY